MMMMMMMMMEMMMMMMMRGEAEPTLGKSRGKIGTFKHKSRFTFNFNYFFHNNKYTNTRCEEITTSSDVHRALTNM